jgi:hypothetical protein
VSGFGEQASRWSSPNVAFYLHAEGAPGLPFGAVEQAVVKAWQTWEQPACSALDGQNWGIQSGPAEPRDGRNTVQWVGDWSARGYADDSAGVTDVQYARIGDEPWQIVEADIYLNAEHYSWQLDGDEDAGRNVRGVLTHELGHAFGLWHPCEPDGADGAPLCDQAPEMLHTTMHPTYSPAQGNLSADDQAGICFLYPLATCEETGCAEGFACTVRGCEAACEPACGADEQCVAGRCLARTPPDGADDEGFDLGQPCAGSDECPGSQCLQIDGAAVCTRACESLADCSGGWTCETLDERRVCTPPLIVQPSGGCAVSGAVARGQSVSLVSSFAFLALSLMLGCARRSRRRSAIAWKLERE